jgi:hypothetical protein
MKPEEKVSVQFAKLIVGILKRAIGKMWIRTFRLKVAALDSTINWEVRRSQDLQSTCKLKKLAMRKNTLS